MGRKGGYFQKLSLGSKTSDMISEGLGGCLKASLQICAPKISAMDGGLSGGSSVRKPGSEDPHRR